MSHTYDIACRKCKTTMWIGQGWPRAQRYIYGTEQHVEALAAFLFKHEGHPLVFLDSADVDYRYERIDSDVVEPQGCAA